ncbi:MAG: RNA polymerase sigma factor RpoD/SigA [Candidatus Krumholzibacteria bacterium]|nr:RNA polymerase sigma factor RpoD/SigA [Candidatus Krumholzibacteria bacterium]
MTTDRKTSSIDSRYFEDVGRYPLLSRSEEIELARKIRDGDEEARKILILSNLKLVITIAKSYSSYGVPFLDLIEEGNLGLIKAVSRFDPEKGFRFSTYSSWWIKQSIVRAISNFSRTIRIPIHVFQLMKKYMAVEKTAENMSQEEKADVLGISSKKLRMIENLVMNIKALDVSSSVDSFNELATNFDPPDDTDAEKIILQQIEHEELSRLLDRLSEREKLILKIRYGFDDGVTHTLAETGLVIKVSRERVRQLEVRALRKLRCLLEAQDPAEENLCQ